MGQLLCEVFRSSYGDCSNSGISSKYNEVMLFDGETDSTIRAYLSEAERRWASLGKAERVAYPVILVRRRISGADYLHVEPWWDPKEGPKPHFMYGGCCIYTSDGRFPNEYPLRLHDRRENIRG